MPSFSLAHPNCHTSVPAESSANRTEKGLINNEWSGARYFASNPQDRNPRLVCFDLQSSSNSSTVSARRCTIGPGVESHRPFGRRRAASWLYLCAAGLQHIARASLEVGQGQSLEVAKQKLPTSERILYQVVERP